MLRGWSKSPYRPPAWQEKYEAKMTEISWELKEKYVKTDVFFFVGGGFLQMPQTTVYIFKFQKIYGTRIYLCTYI